MGMVEIEIEAELHEEVEKIFNEHNRILKAIGIQRVDDLIAVFVLTRLIQLERQFEKRGD